jgi:hypothetical protein
MLKALCWLHWPLADNREGLLREDNDDNFVKDYAEDLMLMLHGSRLKLGSACYYSVQNLLSSRLLSKNLNIKIYRTIILPVVLYGCEA